MRRSFTLPLTLVCTLALAPLACGDGGGPVDSGVADDKVGKELTADEEDQLCESYADNLAHQNSAGELKEFGCVLIGLTFTQSSKNTPEECETLAQMCRDGAGEDHGNSDDGAQMCTLPFDLAACDAVVADIEACLTEKNEATGKAIREASCDAAGTMPVAPVPGPACSKIKSTCIGIV